MVARLNDGSWSAPSAIGTVGVGWGAQLGMELTDVLVVLHTRDAVRTFAGLGQVCAGAEASVTVGPAGAKRSARRPTRKRVSGKMRARGRELAG